MNRLTTFSEVSANNSALQKIRVYGMKTVSNRIAQIYLEQVFSANVDERQLLQRTGINMQELSVANGRLDAQRHFRFFELYTSIFPEVQFDSEPDLSFLFSNFNVLGAVCGNAPTLLEALKAYVRYRTLIGECDDIEFVIQDHYLKIVYHSESDNPLITKLVVLNHFYVFYAIVREYVDDNSANLGLRLNFPISIEEKRNLSEIFYCSVESGIQNSYYIHRQCLHLPHKSSNSALQPYLLQQAEEQLQQLRPALTYSAQVEKILQKLIWTELDIDCHAESMQTLVCEQLRISRWTLARRLNQENINFSGIYTKVRCAEASRLLAEPQFSLLYISQSLGFTNQSSFNRFFREQFGCTPSHYRQHHVAE